MRDEGEKKDNRRQIGAEISEWVETEGLISRIDGKTVSQTERAKCCSCCHYCPVVISPNNPTETRWVTGRRQAHTVNSGNPHFISASQQPTATCGCSGELVKLMKIHGRWTHIAQQNTVTPDYLTKGSQSLLPVKTSAQAHDKHPDTPTHTSEVD